LARIQAAGVNGFVKSSIKLEGELGEICDETEAPITV
jgi:hypothetical protein